MTEERKKYWEMVNQSVLGYVGPRLLEAAEALWPDPPPERERGQDEFAVTKRMTQEEFEREYPNPVYDEAVEGSSTVMSIWSRGNLLEVYGDRIQPHHKKILEALSEGKHLDVRAIPQPKKIDLTKVREIIERQTEELLTGRVHRSRGECLGVYSLKDKQPNQEATMAISVDTAKNPERFRVEKDKYTDQEGRDFDEAIMEMVDAWKPEVAATFKVLLVGLGLNFSDCQKTRKQKDLVNSRSWPTAPDVPLTSSQTFTVEEGKQMEDKFVEIVEAWSPETTASVYARLGHRGVDISKAQQIRENAKLSG